MDSRDYEALTARLRKTSLLAVVFLLLVVGLLVVGIYGLRWLQQSRIQDREVSAVELLRLVGDALHAYGEQFGGYPDRLERLRGAEEHGGGYRPPERARLLHSAFAKSRLEHGGYVFTYTPVGAGQTWAATVPLVEGYVLEARPAQAAAKGQQFFYTDQTRIVRSKRGEPANAAAPAVE